MHRRRDPEHRPDGRRHASASPGYRPEYGASCHRFSSPRHILWNRYWPPFFGALHALAVDYAGRRLDLAIRLLAAFLVESVMDFRQGAIIFPALQILMHRALRRRIAGDIAPLAARA